MRILLVNDDGFGEPGLKALEKALSDYETVTVAPQEHHSGAGMSINLFSKLSIQKHGPAEYSVGGTPVDCVKLALAEILKGAPPDLVVSGINPGANLANNIWYSGTVAAATEAAFWGIPAIAISQEYRSSPDFSRSAEVIRKVVDDGVFKMISHGHIININVPGEANGLFRLTAQGSFAHEIPFVSGPDGSWYRYGPYEIQKVREPGGTDVHALSEGVVSLTLLSTTRSHSDFSDELECWCSAQH